VHITFLHVNDSHGVGVTVTNGACCLARVATIVKDVEAEAGIDRVIVSNGGDIGVHCHDQDYLSASTRGKAEIIAMNAIGFDAMTPGNHEADKGLAWLQQLMGLSQFPWLGANVYHANTTNLLMSGGSHVFFDVKGVKVGIMGLCPASGKWNILREGTIDGRNENTVGAELAPILRPKCDLLVALTHIGDEADAVLATQDIDLIMGGHEHSQLDGKTVSGTRIVQARWHHEFVARVDVTLSDDSGTWKVTRMASQLLPTSNYEPDQRTVALLKKLEELVRAGSNLDDYYEAKHTPR
jgi:5'-nucleotidase